MHTGFFCFNSLLIVASHSDPKCPLLVYLAVLISEDTDAHSVPNIESEVLTRKSLHLLVCFYVHNFQPA